MRAGDAAGDMPRDACVVVREVAEESPTWAAGLRRGMLITHVGAQRVEAPDEFQKATAGKEGDVSLKSRTAPARLPRSPSRPRRLL